MENLSRQREELLEKIRRIAETCEGIENPENARRVAELNGRQAELLAKKDELKSQISALDGELDAIGKSISDLSGSGIEKILQAIKNQRWYFFNNNDKILFDRDTALIWANLRHFPYKNPDHSDGYYFLSDIKKNLSEQANSHGFGGLKDWKIPTPHELWKMIADRTFPFQQGSGWQIQDFLYWCVEYNNNSFGGKNLADSGGNATANIKTDICVHIIPCSHALVPKNFSATPQEILNIFTRNNLVPKFNDEATNHLYRKIFVEKIALMKQLAATEARIAELQPAQIKLTAHFNYKPLLAKFDTAAIAKSPIKFFYAVLGLTDELLNILQQFEAAQKETIAENLSITLNLNAKFTANPNLTPEENSLLAERQRFLARRLELNTDEPKRKILSVKAQAENFFTRLETINAGDNAICELAALQAEPRADFELLVENLSRIITDAQRKVDFFTANKNLVVSLVNSQAEWSDAYKAFKTSLREELSAACRNESIDDENFAAWYEDWRNKRFALEQRFLPLIEFALKDNLTDAAERVINALRNYRDAVDKFYLHERKNIYQKFAFQSGGDLQEKFETESELYKLTEKFQRDLQEIIFSCDKTDARIFLLRWAEPLLNLPLDELSKFIRDRELDAISDEILTQFAELRRQNFEKYLADAQSCGEALQRRETEFNALIFRMRKDLQK